MASGLTQQVVKQIVVLISAALSFVAGLAWNDVITAEFEKYPKLKEYGPWIYAIAVTILAIVVAAVFAKAQAMVGIKA